MTEPYRPANGTEGEWFERTPELLAEIERIKASSLTDGVGT